MQTRTINDGGFPMRWDEEGDGAAVVFLHGIPTGPKLWRRVLPLLSGCRRLAWEMPGYAGSISQGLGRDISVARQAEYLMRWMDAIRLDRAVFVGHDLGGGVAQIAAVEHRDRCAGLVLTNSICYDSWPIPQVKAMRALGGAVRHLPNAVFRPLLRSFLRSGHDDAEVAAESAAVHLAPYLETDGAAAMVRQARALDVDDTRRVAPRLRELAALPARLVWGAADPFQPLDYGQRLAGDLDAELDRIEGGKHFTPEDHPERIAFAVQAVLSAVGWREAAPARLSETLPPAGL